MDNIFLDVVIETAKESIKISKQIRELRDKDMTQIQSLAKRESESGMKVLSHLFGSPIVTTKSIMNWTCFTRAGAQKVIDRLVSMDILKPVMKKTSYDRVYTYKNYINLFRD